MATIPKRFFKVEMTFLTPCFATKPANTDIMSEYLIEKKKQEIMKTSDKKLSPAEKKELLDKFGPVPDIDQVPEEEQKVLNVFAKDGEHYILEGYMFNGICKSCLEARKCVKESAYYGKQAKTSDRVFKNGEKEKAINFNIQVENIFIDISPEGVYTCNPDEQVLDPTDHVHVRTRPIRGDQMGKVFVSLKSAQTIPPKTKTFPFYIMFEERPDCDVEGMIREVLDDFATFHGFGGRRSDGFGAVYSKYEEVNAERVYDPEICAFKIIEKDKDGNVISSRPWNALR